MTTETKEQQDVIETEPQQAVALVRTEQPTPMMLLQQAITNNVDVEKLEKLMDLQERWERNQAERAFSEAMHACQQEMPRVVRDKVNTQTNSRYARLETVQDKCQPIYAKHGFSLNYGEADSPIEKWKRTVCDVRHVGGACHRYHLDLPVDGIGPKGNPIGGMNAVQGCISTTSYGQRRLLCMIFNIVIADEDNDGQTDLVDEKQAIVLREMAEECGGDTLQKFLAFAGVSNFEDIPASRYNELKAKIKAKLEGRSR